MYQRLQRFQFGVAVFTIEHIHAIIMSGQLNLIMEVMLVVYKDLEEYLGEALDGFSGERKEIKKLISVLLWCTQSHYTEEGAVIISTNFLRTYLKSSQAAFNRVNSDYGLFDVGTYSQGSARPLYPRPLVTELLVGFLIHQESSRLMILDGKHSRPRYAKKKDFNVVIDNIEIPTGVKIDTESMTHYFINLKPKSDSTEDSRKFIVYKQEVMKFVNLSNNNIFDYGVVPQMYKRAENGRLFGTGASIQRSHRDLRTALMNGSYDYDFENCHPSILNQQDCKTPTLSEYVQNKSKIRKELTEYLGLDPDNQDCIDITKQCILAVTFGAGKCIQDGKAIVQYLGKENARHFWENGFVTEFKKDVEIAGRKLLDYEGKADIQFWKNLANKLQNIESQMLNVCCRGNNPCVLMFDGFISKEDLDTRKLEELVRLELGYEMKISKKVIRYGD